MAATPAAREQMRDYLSENMLPVKDVDLDDILGPLEPNLDDEWWTSDDERAMRKDWKRSKEKKEFAKLSPPITSADGAVFAAIQGMWKICLRVLRCSPFAVLSVRNQLAYHPGRDEPNSSSALWSREFCDEFRKIITHPVFEADVRIVALVLQYTVICRTDDRGLWDMTQATSCQVLADFKRNLDKATGSLAKSVHRMHDRVRRRSLDANIKPSQLSNLLHHIGESVQVCSKKRKTFTDARQDVYHVTLCDVTTVLKAIDTMSPTGWPLYIPTTAALQGHRGEEVQRCPSSKQG